MLKISLLLVVRHHLSALVGPLIETPHRLLPSRPAGFGAPHIALRYHPVSGAGWNHLWALGATPFGPLSALTSLSAATASLVGRNLALVELDRQAARVAAVLQVRGSDG